jgi:hypothetical protein
VRLESNIARVRERLGGIRTAAGVAMMKTLDAAYWLPRAKEVAERVLRALAKPEHAEYVASFVETVTSEVWRGEDGTGFVLKMRGGSRVKLPVALPFLVEAARASGREGSPAYRLKEVFWENRDQAYDTILQWVRAEKRKSAEDVELGDERVANRIYAILFGRERTWGRELASGGLLRALTDFARRQAAEKSLDAETVEEWLQAVLLAWGKMLEAELPIKFAAEFHQASTEGAVAKA